MRKFLATALLFAAGAASAGPVYWVDRHVGNGSVTGYLETDGTTGVLGIWNITHWKLVIRGESGGDRELEKGVRGIGTFGGFGLSATETTISFDFGENSTFWIFYDPVPSPWSGAWSLNGTDVPQSYLAGQPWEGLYVGQERQALVIHAPNAQVIATRNLNDIPEPSALLVTLAGLFTAAVALRSQRG